jgi:hypothetical protein
MKSFCDTLASVFLTLGLMLLVASVMLMPTSQVMADDGTGDVTVWPCFGCDEEP